MTEFHNLVHQVHEAAACGETATVQLLVKENKILESVTEVLSVRYHPDFVIFLF
jgi:NifU-like protein involved in Fe-S cluster formation